MKMLEREPGMRYLSDANDVGRLIERLQPSIPASDAHLARGKAVPVPHDAAESH